MRALTIIPIFFLLGSTLLLLLTIINGSGTSSILGKFYWSETDTSGIEGAPFDRTRWTFYRICDVSSDGRNSNCQKSSAAYPYSPKDNFNSEEGLPNSFIDDRNTYFYLSRCGWAFILVALVFAVLALIFVPINFCTSIGGTIGSIFTFISFLFTITAAALITAAHVKGKHEFNNAGHSTNLGAKAFGILWAAVACLLISFATSIGACVATFKTKRRNKNRYDQGVQPVSSYQKEQVGPEYQQRGHYADDENVVGGEPVSDASKFRFFRVKRAKNEAEEI
ncbi:unnamed protein product [Candida verbasci]|uniref:Uncharacterized protein n=1 Tax=Candida verbasci TaxID=1227364 RepID=A0A9W4TXF8_9ASCO|nr:unnamed protein product [Candida verbasci]